MHSGTVGTDKALFDCGLGREGGTGPQSKEHSTWSHDYLSRKYICRHTLLDEAQVALVRRLAEKAFEGANKLKAGRECRTGSR